MPIFTQSLQKIDPTKPEDAIRKMAKHITHIQEQLEYKMYNLDSQNVREIDTDKTTITDSTGSANIGSYINITGANGESFSVGRNSKGNFEFSIKGKGGTQTFYLDSSGNLVITKNATLTIDGGEW